MSWDLQENDVFYLWEAAEKDADLKITSDDIQIS
jgi:hypothetical protein